MATMINGGREDVHASASANVEQPSPLQIVTSTIWDTVCSKAFALGAAVGATLMYVGHELMHRQRLHFVSAPDSSPPLASDRQTPLKEA